MRDRIMLRQLYRAGGGGELKYGFSVYGKNV